MRRVFSLLFLAVLVVAVGGCARAPEAAASEVIKLPAFELEALGGGTLSTADFAGKVVVFEFWATWCVPCHAQADILKGLYNEYGNRGVEFVAINLGEDESVVKAFLERRPVPYRVLMDPREEVSAMLGIYGLPTVMVVDRAGGIAFVRTGLSTGSVLRKHLEALAPQGGPTAA